MTPTLLSAMPFAELLGAELISAEPDLVAAQLQWDARLCTVGGALHGGALMALADSCGGICAFLNLPSGSGGTATIESKTNFIRAVHQGAVTARARPLHVGRRTIVVETEILDDQDRLVAKVTQTQAVLRSQLESV